METVMVHKTVGLLRNVIKKRKQFIALAKNIVKADNALVITLTDNTLAVGGFTDSDAVQLFMLGRATGQCVEASYNRNPEIDVFDNLAQPNIVATTYLTKKGIIE